MPSLTETPTLPAPPGPTLQSATVGAPGAAHRLRISAASGWQAIHFAELWRYRELVGFLALRDIKVRYKQTALGAAWAVLQPAMNTLMFWLFFNKLAGVQLAGSAPYAVAAFCGMLPWQLFETSLTESSNSLVGNQNLITKIYFPRLAIPLSSLLSGLLDFGIASVLLMGMMTWYRVTPSWTLLTLPLFVMLALAAATAVGLWLSALNVMFRDVRYAIPFLARLWFFATPIGYDAARIGEKFGKTWQLVYGLNPMAGVVEGFRWALLGGSYPAPSPLLLMASTVATVLLLIGGLFYFRRMEQGFADMV